MTRMTWPGQDLGPRKSKCPNVETSLAFLGNGKAASGLAMASNVVTEDWVRQSGRSFRPRGDVFFYSKPLDCIRHESGMIYFIH